MRLGAVFALVCATGVASAGGIAQLRQFVDTARSAQGEFEQTVFAASGRKPQRASGSFVFARPGKFRWTYDKPYPQVLVSDGDKLWSWDRDLNQVTVKRLGDALGSTPAAILAGDDAIERNFELAEAGSSDGLEWVHAKPRQADSSFESMRMGFAGGNLKRMELKDNFGQTTLIEFRSLVSGARPDSAQFRFVAPPGADVIGD
ncbi:outer membrane lipoprotein chaperone LolA [Aromatoleum toluolicum]|nr:outer membrane lipoprotein chaperone LolA [Aromatoleum toluolicum]NMG00122.2 outer membrane lipoprotein chaperone LolA [Aromatoleum toluolicum]